VSLTSTMMWSRLMCWFSYTLHAGLRNNLNYVSVLLGMHFGFNPRLYTNGFYHVCVTSVDKYHLTHPCNLIWVYILRFLIRNNLMNLKANIVDPDETASLLFPLSDNVNTVRSAPLLFQLN
jgi:hypothetical protein